MDNFDVSGIEFIDLSDVEEQEKQWIQRSLASCNSKVKGPWKISQLLEPKVSTQKSSNSANIYQQNQHLLYSNIIHTNNINLIENFQAPHPPIYSASYQVQPVFPQFTVQPEFYQVQCPPQYQPPFVPPNLNYPIPSEPIIPFSTQNCQPIQNVDIDNEQPIDSNKNKTYNDETQNSSQPNSTFSNNNEPNLNENKIDEAIVNGHMENGCTPNNNSANIAQQNQGPNNVIKSHESGDPPKPANISWASLLKKPGDQPTAETTVQSKKTTPIATHNNNTTEQFNVKKKSELLHLEDPHYYRMGEFLIDYTVDNRIISLQPRGLINRSNYCYINSILQALLACPPVYNLLSGLALNINTSDKKKYTPIIDNMAIFVKEFHHLPAGQRVGRRSDKNQRKETVSVTCEPPFEPNWIYKMLSGKRSDSFVVEGRQEDAEEFLGCLLNGLNDEMLELLKLAGKTVETKPKPDIISESPEDKEWQVMGPKNKGCVTRRTEMIKTPISDIFGGHLRSRIHRTGDLSTDNIQPFFTLQLNIETATNVKEALEALACKNQLEGVTSSKTNEEVEAWQQVTIEELPIVLVLHLKCFNFRPDGCTKIIKSIEFPIDLKIDSKLLSSKTNYSAKEKQYKLFAVVYHDGKEVSKGHYITDAYHVGYASWLRYDDASVKPVLEEQVLKPSGSRVPYLLFYRRSDSVKNK